MRILYGVVGEGMGHATRSRVVLEHLTKNHDVHIVVSGRAKDYLQKRFENVHNIWGLTLQYEGNGVNTWQTILQNVKGAVSGWPQNIRTYFELAEKFEPDVVVSDFESFSYLLGRNFRIPVISVDNMQIINRCAHDKDLLGDEFGKFELARAVVKSKLPGAFRYLVTTFFYPELRKKRTELLPPILRPEILAAKSEKGNHWLVYSTQSGNSEMLDALHDLKIDARVYGQKRDLKADLKEGGLTFRPFSESTFIDDLRTAKAVIAGGGFTLMSECVYLHKPMLSVPLDGQFEQSLNAMYLEKLGYGLRAKQLDVSTIKNFEEKIATCEKALESYSQDENKKLLDSLDAALSAAQEWKGRWLFSEDGKE